MGSSGAAPSAAGEFGGVDLVTQSELATALGTSVSDAAYDATAWDGVTTVAPSKNAVRDALVAAAATSSPFPKSILRLAVQTPVNQVGWNNPGVYNSGFFCVRNYTDNGNVNNLIEWDEVLAAGTWTFDLFHHTDTDKGQYTLKIDGTTYGTPIEGYNVGGITQRKDSLTGLVLPAPSAVRRVRLIMATKGSGSAFNGSINGYAFTQTA